MKAWDKKYPFIHSAMGDSIFILLPPFIICAVLFFLPNEWLFGDQLPPWSWLLLIVGVDVAHVYSTLYRSYLNKEAFGKYRRNMLMIPIIAFIGGALLYSTGSNHFWRCLAYLAVFHFVRQQYGFMRIYSRKEPRDKIIRLLERIIIYSAAVYPLLYWHFSADRNFHWFIDGDFMLLPKSPAIERIAFILYLCTLATWIILIIRELRQKRFNLPKHALIAGTYLSWYFGIVYFNGDFAFTALNVISHGIPYMALVWFAKTKAERQQQVTTRSYTKYFIVIFILSILTFAFIEEGLWDSLHWRDRPEYFAWFYFIPRITSPEFLSLIVPLLALPQMTHYILDGFIWKVSKPEVQEELGLTVKQN